MTDKLSVAIKMYYQLNVLEVEEFLERTGLIRDDSSKWLEIVEQINGQNDIMNVKETSVFLKKSPSTIRRLIKEGKIKVLFDKGEPLILKRQFFENATFKTEITNSQTLPTGKRKYTKKALPQGQDF